MWRMWLAALFWGLNWPAVKIMLTGISPWTLRALGLTAGGAILAAVTRASGTSFAIASRDRRRLVVASFLNVACFNVFAVFAQLSMPTSRAAILTFTMPFWATLFGRFVLNEPIDGLRAASLAVGGAGLVILSSSFWGDIAGGRLPLGLVYVLAAAVCWAAGTVYMKKHRIDAPPLAVTTWQVIVSAVICTLGMLLLETPRIDLSQPHVAAALAYHVAFPQAASYVLWFGLVARVSSSTASLGTLLVPVFGVVGAVTILGERPTPLDLLGFALLLLAVASDQFIRSRTASSR